MAVVLAEGEAQVEDGKMYLTVLVAILFVVTLGGYLKVYNDIIRALNSIKQAWSNVEVELKRRFELIDNLINVAKGYAKHERDTFEAVTAMRSDSAQGANQAEAKVRQNLNTLIALSESYPELKADTQFRQLSTELVTTENRIAERRSAYNQTVTFYKNLVQVIPNNIVFWLHEFEMQELFDAPDEIVNQVPVVKLL